MSDRPILKRSDLQKFLPDERTIRTFEKLFSLANNNSDEIDQLFELVNALEVKPPAQADNSVKTDYIDLPASGPHVTMPRRIQWNEDDGTLDVGLLNDVVLQCGQEMHYYAKNTDATNIPDGGSVMATGTIGNSGKLTIGKAVADGSIDAKYMLGIATQTIAPGEFGYVTNFGLVRGLNTSAYNDGDLLYFDPATPGGLTDTMPEAPEFKPPIAIVIHAHSNGSIFVRMKNGEYINTLIDVHADAPSDNDVLHWVNANSRWENSHILQGLQFGDSTNYSTFENDGTYVAYGDATVWDDIDFPIIVRTVAANFPVLTTMQGNIKSPVWQVNDYCDLEGREFFHKWKEGSEVFFHAHVVTNGLDGTDRYIRWTVEYCWANMNAQLSAATTIDSGDLLIPANTPDRTHILFPIGSFTPSGGKIAGHVFARLTRIAATGTAPTNNPFCHMLQAHVQIDTIGSRTRLAK